jgi:two-component system, chemotaxis family, CheB/CheR fusion protein
VRSDIPDAPVHVLADSQRIQQVLLNLVNNAFRHAIDTEYVDVRLRQEAEMAVIEVRDYGPGISGEALSNVFSPFYQATDEKLPGSGLGLGLFISREIVSAHGGTIEMHSVDGEGVAVEVRLTLLPEGEDQAVTQKTGLPNDSQGTHDAP